MNRKPGEKQRILVVDDEENLRHMLQLMLQKQGYLVDQAAHGAAALQMASQGSYDFILCDIQMPVMDGADFLKEAVAAGTSGTIIMMSAYGTVDTAIECMKLGAYDYISKPFKSDEIALVLKKAEERERLKSENRRLKDEIGKEYSFASIISKNPRMQEIFSLVRKVCDFKTTVLVLGESGTGKELVARAIHYNSRRKNAPFVAVNCGAIPENLLESELFGHVRGAFTDASADKAGLFEQADGGTLLLDEIGELPLPLQVKLLRVLQEEEIRRVGASASKKVDVRVISATSKDLELEVAGARFREDLYFRLNVFSINLPPLRERMEDIPLLVTHFLGKYDEKYDKRVVRCAPDALKALMNYRWPGNIRELENCIERGMVLCEGETMELGCLPEKLRGAATGDRGPVVPPDSLSLKLAEELLEKDFIRRALEKTGGNRTHAARLLEISHRALLYKLKDYGME
ncbi:MAG: two-component system NtrC family response regulator [Geobacteraceae bacterium]|nr:MAG: two-component system NtrC family response regulator [Geobacteraceae bacterium]